MSETPLECPASVVRECNFPPVEITELHRVGQRETVAFPRWAMTLLIAILSALAGSNAAIWFGLGTKSTSEQLVSAKAELAAELVLARERLVKLEATIPKEYPPKWFGDKVDAMAVTVNENNKILNDLRVEVASLRKDQGP